MVKGNPKSSASSGTRKKHAKKQQRDAPEDVSSPPSKGGGGMSKGGKGSGKKNKEPKVKMYIPPIKPAPVQPDPLETTGLGRTLPPDLTIQLRSLAKKATITKTRALEELQSGWVDKCNAEEEKDLKVWALVEMVPVWLHHIPTLFISPSRRVRLLAATLHSSLLAISDIRDRIIDFLTQTASETQAENILGSWLLAANDVDRQVSGIAAKSRAEFIVVPGGNADPVTNVSGRKVVLEPSTLSSVTSFVQRTALDPSGIYLYFNPIAPPISLSIAHAPHLQEAKKSGRATPSNQAKGKGGTPGKGSNKGTSAVPSYSATPGGDETPRSYTKSEDQEESDTDRKARLRIAALGGIKWLLGTGSLNSDSEQFFGNPALWTCLSSLPQAPWLDDSEFESFGYAQPSVRKAGWSLVQTMISSTSAVLSQDVQNILGVAILRSAWIETDTLVQNAMWQPLLVFLQKYPQSWLLGDTPSKEEEHEEHNAGDEPSQQATASSTSSPAPQVFLDFLAFLSSGCQGSPIQGLPTVVLVLSTIPPSVLFTTPAASLSSTEDPEDTTTEAPASSEPLVPFFDALWSSLSSRALSALNRASTHTALLSALLECLVFIIRRLHSRPREDPPTTSPKVHLDPTQQEHLVVTQLERVWTELATANLKIEPLVAATQIASTVQKLAAVDGHLGDVTWSVVADKLKETAISKQGEAGRLVSTSMKVFLDSFIGKEQQLGLHPKAEALLKQLLSDEVGRLRRALDVRTDEPSDSEAADALQFQLLVDLIGQFKGLLWSDEVFTSVLDELLMQHAYVLLNGSASSSQILSSYLGHRNNQSKCLGVWHSLLGSTADASLSMASSSSSTTNTDVQAIKKLVSFAQRAQIPTYLKPKKDELDAIFGGLVGRILVNPTSKDVSDDAGVVKGVISHPDNFISPDAFDSAVSLIVTTYKTCVEKILQDNVDLETLATLDRCLDLVETIFPTLLRSHKDSHREPTLQLIPSIFLHAFLAPARLKDEDEDQPQLLSDSHHISQRLWERWLSALSDDSALQHRVTSRIKQKLRMIARGVEYAILPQDVIDLLSLKSPSINVDLLRDIFPEAGELDDTLNSLFSGLVHPSIIVLDDLLPTSSSSTASASREQIVTDSYGFSSYARIVNGLLHLFISDRPLAKQHVWAVRHLIALSLYAGDLLAMSVSASAWNPVFDGSVVSRQSLIELRTDVRKVLVYLFNSFAETEPGWTRGVVADLLNQERRQTLAAPQKLLHDLVQTSRASDTVRDARILKVVLDSVLAAASHDGLDAAEADQWVMLVRMLEQSAPQTCISILSVLSSSGAEPPRLDRYRNELAASLLGITPRSFNTAGFLTLRILAASAPPPDSAIVFLPTPRAVNIVKALQSWILTDSDDDEVDEEVESAMLGIFVHLVPILQGVTGSHWQFIFDVLEGVLERVGADADSTDEDESQQPTEEGSSLVALARALRLITVVEDLSKRNKTLMEDWRERRTTVLTMVKDSGVLQQNHPLSHSTPLSTLRLLALSILEDMPSNLIDEQMLPKLSPLILDSSNQVQKTAYHLLSRATQKRTENAVIEAGVDTEQAVKPVLLQDLLDLVMRDVWNADDGESDAAATADVFAYLLGWMLVFDSFTNVSFKVKSAYIEQLRGLNVIVEHFIPFFLKQLGLDKGVPTRAFKLGIWAVDAFYINLYEPGRPHSLPVLTAHVYYRALLTIPSLIHAWLLDCKDRQLSTAVTTYTSMHFSPVLIKTELEHVRTHAVSDKLADESLSIKVATTNEVIAAYSVDEHQLEIRIRIPSDWPLHRAEVKDVKRVGVDENRWRAWVLGVQQTIWAHNGRIIDGLELFKKNVTLHFEGQVECAICYSIISAMDGSLPKKPCKTCKNRFHASCLYKWFNTSHSSSCPLCRSDII